MLLFRSPLQSCRSIEATTATATSDSQRDLCNESSVTVNIANMSRIFPRCILHFILHIKHCILQVLKSAIATIWPTMYQLGQAHIV